MVVYRDGIYEVKKDNRGYVLINTLGDYDNHGHLKKLKTCKLVIKLMQNETVPHSPYLRGTVLRVSTNKKYKDKVRRKVAKDRDRQSYYNKNNHNLR